MPTDASKLDNPVWATLSEELARFGRSNGDTRWFPQSIAPFVSIPSSYVMPNLEAAFTGGMGAAAYFVGVCPSQLPSGWRCTSQSQVLQMLPPVKLEVDDATLGRELGAEDRQQLYDLAQIAFPLFFRPRTSELGTYLGVFEEGKLVAMAGERMRVGGFQEISGVCTHPEHLGKGYARELTRSLLKRHRDKSLSSFLHVSESNGGARRLYKAMGFTERANLLMVKVERSPP
jgi:GNAT superfamily N-acetyltransferase